MNLLPRLQDGLGVLFLAVFLVNFSHWIRKNQSGCLLFVPSSTWGRAGVYFFGLFGPAMFFLGKLVDFAELTMVGICMTNGCLVYMNIAALAQRVRIGSPKR